MTQRPYGHTDGRGRLLRIGLSDVPVVDPRDVSKVTTLQRMKRYYDQGRREVPDIQPGDKVWLDARNIALPGTRKLNPRRLGPFLVERKIGELNFELKLPASMRIHPVFHASLLTKFVADTIPGRVPTPPDPVSVDGDIEYEVQEVLNSRRTGRGHKLQYLVRWKGYGPDEDSWVNASDMEHAPTKVRAYYRKYPDAVR